MSSLKTAMKSGQRTHRERGQVSGRKHLGNLEKHKDYVLRAKDFQHKKKAIKNLKKKAVEKNPDEFYFQMINSKTKDGVHVKERATSNHYSREQIKLMKTQDMNYLNIKQSTEAKKIEKMKSNLHFTSLADEQPRSHIFFVDSEKEVSTFDPAKKLNTLPELISRTHNIPTMDTLSRIDFEEHNSLDQGSSKAYKELEQRIARKKKLDGAREGLAQQRKLMAGGGGVKKKKMRKGKPVYKWNTVRKR